MQIKFLIASLLLCLSISIYGQTSNFKVMYYNILNYPNNGNSNSDGNNTAREGYFSTIAEEVDADFILVQELGTDQGADDLVTALNNNTSGKTFDRAPLFDSNAEGMLFYNTAVANFISQDFINTTNSAAAPNGNVQFSPRKSTYFQIEIFDPATPSQVDTLHFINVHLKASSSNGSSSTLPDRERRVLGMLDVIDYVNLNLNANDNLIIGGDFNFYGSLDSDFFNSTYDEPAYGLLTRPFTNGNQFNDAIGGWIRDENTPAFLCKYSQSTRFSASYGNGGAAGGLNDRFDLILFNDALRDNYHRTKYVENSYTNIGNPKVYDGNATDITGPIQDEIQKMSDHYPVLIELEYNGSASCFFGYSNVENTNCNLQDYTFEVHFSAFNDNGSYEIVDITNGNTVLATGTSSPISVSLPNNTSTTPFNIIIRDVAQPSCSSPAMTVYPQDCSGDCTLNITAINPICQTGSNYDLEICFNYQNPLSANVEITVDGTNLGVFPYPATSGDCITIPASTLGLVGNGTPNLEVQLKDAASSNNITEPFISELHYESTGVDINEFVEITGQAGTFLGDYVIVAYNGTGSSLATQLYEIWPLYGTIPNQNGSCGSISIPFGESILQNGLDGLALCKNDDVHTLVELISYEGSFTATFGPAAGIMSTDIGVNESTSTPTNFSLQKTDTGWTGPLANTAGQLNAGLTTCGANSSLECMTTAFYNEPDCTQCFIDIAQVTTTCQGTDFDLDICINYQNPVSSNLNVIVNGTNYGPLPYPSTSGDCISLSAATLGIVGDGSSPLEIDVEDAGGGSLSGEPFISELHYDNASTDEGEFFEITAPAGTDLSDYEVYAYDTDGLVDDSDVLAGVVMDQGSGCGTIEFTKDAIGSNYFENETNGIALVKISTGALIEFISHEGVILAGDGPANGLSSMDIGVQETSGTAIGFSLQLTDAGWTGPTTESPGSLNTGLTSCGAVSTCGDTFMGTLPACDNCQSIRTISSQGVSIPDGLYQASNSIISQATVVSGGNVTFDAGVEINLNAGFCVEPNAVFEAIIGGCNPLQNETIESN